MAPAENNYNIKNSDIVIITRTLPAAQKTASKIEGLGLQPIVLPAANIISNDCEINLEGVQALIVTSSNAPRVAHINDAMLNMPIYAVGDATKDACIKRGFVNVISAGGDASALAVLIVDRLKPKDGKLLHLRGNDIAGDVGSLLRSCGFMVDNAVCYKAVDNPEFKQSIAKIIKDNHGYIMFHSPKGAERFMNAIGNISLKNYIAITISQAATAPIENLDWHEIKISTHPKEDDMIALFK